MEYTSHVASTTALIGAISADLLTTVGIAVSATLSIAVLLVGVGFAWRKLKQKAVGKGF